MNEFIKYIIQFGSLNEQQLDLISNKSFVLNLHKGEYFSEVGKVAKQVGFILEGITRVYYYNDGEEITKYFIDENNIVFDIESFDNEVASTAYVEAITDCKILVFSKKDWQELLNTIIGWNAIAYRIISKALLLKVERRSPLVSDDAASRYLKFMEIYPNMVNRIPLSYIASYLGITQSSLSRIRKNI